MAAVHMSRTRVSYHLAHQWMRKRLNAGCTIPDRAPQGADAGWFAARAVVLGSGRQPSPVYDHALHYNGTNVRRAQEGGAA